MAFKIKEILLESSNFAYYQVSADKQDRLSNLSKINIFIGENNSGKSRLLRELFKTKLEILLDGLDYPKLIQLVQNYFLPLQANKSLSNVVILTQGFNHFQTLIQNLDPLKTSQQIIGIVHELRESFDKIQGNVSFGEYDNKRLQEGINILLNEINNSVIPVNYYNYQKLYIPVLRGLRPVAKAVTKVDDDYYIDRTIKDYFTVRHPSGGTSPEIEQNKVFTGLNLYEEVKNHLLGSQDKRELVRDFEKFLSVNFFHNKSVTLIPRLKNDDGSLNDVIHVKIGDEKEKPIYDLGDGIQHIIILTFQMFMNKGKDMLFFIEEPELYLHPGMQRIFIDTITTHKGFENFQYFIATHSNHFLDITLDTDQISVYTFKKTNEVDEAGHSFFSVENVNNDAVSTLELIGVRNSSVFLSNCTIWVEGITDRMYLRKYLELYQNKLSKEYDEMLAKHEDAIHPKLFKEDLHYSFVEYGGGNITHWSFLGDEDNKGIPTSDYKKITNKIFLISDKDGAGLISSDEQNKKDKEYKLKRHQALENHFTDNEGKYHCLDCTEIENLLMPHVLQKVIGIYEKNKGNTGDIPLFNYEEYKNEYLGRFIDNKFTNKKIKSYQEESGTINKKVEFAKRVTTYKIHDIPILNDFEKDLSEEAQALTKKIYDFISDKNS